MIYILFCAYNEENDLPGLLEDIRAQRWACPYRVIAVNDGSIDRTGRVLDEARTLMPLTVITHEKNSGLGAALATGFAAVEKEIADADVLVTMDADRTHPPDMIALLQENIGSGADIVIASRYAQGGRQYGVPLYRRILSRGASVVLGVAWPGQGIRDCTSGFRAYSGKVIKEAAGVYGDELVMENGFAATFEILLKTGKLSNKIVEVPLQLHYEKKTGASKMELLPTIRCYARLIAAALSGRYGKQNA